MSENTEDLYPPTKKQKTNVPGENETAMDFSKDVTEMDDKDFSISEEKYENFVSKEEIEKLREFQVLDEVKSNDEDSNEEESDSSDGKSEGVPEDEIEKMLDEDLPEGFKGVPKPKERPYVTRQKTILEEKGINHFEVLPLDWMMVRHYSGMPLYVHRTSRVCTLSKPYFLGKGNTRRHDIPISAIPCLAYRKALEEENKQKEIDRRIEEQIKNGTWMETSKDDGDNRNTENNSNSQKKTSNKDEMSTEKEQVAKDQIVENNIENVKETIDENEMEVDSVESNKTSKCPFQHQMNQANSDKEQNENHLDNIQNINTTLENSTKYDNSDGDLEIPHEITEKQNIENLKQNKEVPNLNNADQNTDENTANKGSTDTDKTNDGNTEEEIPLNRKPVVLPGGIVMPPPRVETVSTSWKTQHLTHEQVYDYCKKLFKFKTVNIMHFKRWADRRKYAKARKTLQYPALPEGTKLITIPAQPSNGVDNGGKAAKRDWVMNMNGRSYLSVFHEYVRRALHKQPVYEFKQLENASHPYQATVVIGDMQYGVGRGSSKRQAKSAAARASIQILIPEMRDQLEPSQKTDTDFSFFDCIGIEDPRIGEFSAASCEPSAHAILRTCLLRNFGAGDRHIHTEMRKLEYQKIELTMKVGKHSATVVCKNKKAAKQRASQAILQALHPHIRSWGSLLRLYGSRSVKSCKEKKLEEQQITLLQDKAQHNEPNYAVLEKLRNEMRKLRERDEAVVPIGTLLVKDDLPKHSGSNLNNVDL